jgi:predicted dehydrogenase
VTTPRVLVCGAGSIGRRHIGNLRRLGAEVSGWRSRTDAGEALARELGIRVHAGLGEAIEAADAVVVATATDRHLEPALAALRAGRALFLEKPVSHSLDGVPELAALAQGRIVEVGCQLRAHPSLRVLAERLAAGADGPVLTFRGAVGQRLDTWRPGTDYRACYSVDASRGGGALFDLVHEIDLVHWLVGPVASVAARLDQAGGLELRAEDLANLILATADGATGLLQLDMLSPVYRRDFELVLRDAVWRWDYAAGTLARDAAGGVEIVHRLPPTFERNDLFLAHMRHFLDRLRDPSLPPLCSLDDGIAVLRTADAARRAAAGRRFVDVAEVAA